MRLNHFTNIILELNAALDTGKYDDIPTLEARQHIEAGDLIPGFDAGCRMLTSARSRQKLLASTNPLSPTYSVHAQATNAAGGWLKGAR
jgi:hypothetical protein